QRADDAGDLDDLRQEMRDAIAQQLAAVAERPHGARRWCEDNERRHGRLGRRNRTGADEPLHLRTSLTADVPPVESAGGEIVRRGDRWVDGGDAADPGRAEQAGYGGPDPACSPDLNPLLAAGGKDMCTAVRCAGK